MMAIQSSFLISDQSFIKILVKQLKSMDNLGRNQNDYRSAENSQLLEYKAISLLYDHFGKGQFDDITAIKALTYFPELDALALEYVPAVNVLSIIFAGTSRWAGRTRIQAAIDVAERIGRFTAEIHKINQDKCPRTELFNCEIYLTGLQTKVDDLLALGVCNEIRYRLEEVLKIAEQYLSGLRENVVVSYLHSDLHMANFLKLKDDRICTIDTSLEFTGPVEQDISNLIIITETPKRRVLGGGAVVRGDVLKEVTQAFLAGYSQRGCYCRSVLTLYRLLSFIRHWAGILDILQRRTPNWISSAFQRVRLNHFMLRYLDAICNDFAKEH